MYFKRRRLLDFDYSSNGAYFVTICTIQKRNYYWCNDQFATSNNIQLTDVGETVRSVVEQISKTIASIQIDNYVIMPNHIHLLVVLNDSSYTISNIVRFIKTQTTKQIGYSIFQRSFHDHIIRDATEYEKIWNYIEDNPRKWNEDKYYLAL